LCNNNTTFNLKTILITGATGFLGSHLASALVKEKFNVVALKRKTSSISRCNGFGEKITWINIEETNELKKRISEFQPEILIHAAWSGVKASERDNREGQEININFLSSLLETIKGSSVKKIIAFGSQAEYGKFEGAIDENQPCRPDSVYGETKLKTLQLLKEFSENHKKEWYWLRLFSVYGPGEDKSWLIPSTINNLISGSEMKLSPCEQRYDYIYVKDFADGIIRVVNKKENESGVFNFSSGQSISIKDIVTFLENKLAPGKGILKIGALPYRSGQVMHMQSISDKFFRTFDFCPAHTIYKGLEETSDWYIKNNGQ